jgi:hypothetical protein
VIRRLLDWLITLGGSWHPVRVETVAEQDLFLYSRGRCRCGWRGDWQGMRVLARQDAYDHQGLGGRA